MENIVAKANNTKYITKEEFEALVSKVAEHKQHLSLVEPQILELQKEVTIKAQQIVASGAVSQIVPEPS